MNRINQCKTNSPPEHTKLQSNKNMVVRGRSVMTWTSRTFAHTSSMTFVRSSSSSSWCLSETLTQTQRLRQEALCVSCLLFHLRDENGISFVFIRMQFVMKDPERPRLFLRQRLLSFCLIPPRHKHALCVFMEKSVYGRSWRKHVCSDIMKALLSRSSGGRAIGELHLDKWRSSSF